jgi:ankyrin repeat protein
LILECGLKEKNPSEVDGKTPLHWAAENGHLETFKVLFEDIPNKNPKDD